MATCCVCMPWLLCSDVDTGGSLRLSFNLDTPSPTHSSSATTFTQREINISPTTTDDGDFGGVWLGGDTSESSTTLSTATVTSHAQSTDYGGKDMSAATHTHRLYVPSTSPYIAYKLLNLCCENMSIKVGRLTHGGSIFAFSSLIIQCILYIYTHCVEYVACTLYSDICKSIN